jgi:simple sugar transport system permease protein
MIKVNILNLGLEGMMLVGAFFAAAGTYWTENLMVGLLCGILASLVVAMIFGLLTINLGADPIIVGIAVNLAAIGLTTVLLELFFGVRGLLRSERIVSFTSINLAWVEELPLVGPFLNDQDPIAYITLILAVVATIVLYRTRLGLRIRAIGEHPEAAATAGINLNLYRHIASLTCGFLCGIAGVYLSLGGLSMFTENMTAGKGFIALAAALFGWGAPVMAIIASIIFGYATALALRFQGIGIPSHFVLMTPYILTLVLLLIRRLRELQIERLTDQGSHI